MPVLVAAALVVLLTLAITRAEAHAPMSTSRPRGIRNHNPGNLRRTADVWQGQSAAQSDPEFVQFISPRWGLRALATTLANYRRIWGLTTVRQIVSRYAPAAGAGAGGTYTNPTDAYVQLVASRLGVHPDEDVQVLNRDVMVPLMRAIVQMENGQDPYAHYLYDAAYGEAVTHG